MNRQLFTNAADIHAPVVSQAQKAGIEKANRQLLELQLLEKRLELTPRPYEAHIQFSNFCNMSCIMCWNGNNPATKKLGDELQQKIRTQVAPELSILEPFSGSEPLVLTWEDTRELAEKYGVMLCLTTNVQYLDEAKFHELKDITETLYLSVDCHIPEVLRKIRQRANTDKVLTNIRTTARLAREHNLECTINIVLLTYNAPFLPDTLAAFHEMGIESVNVIQLVDINHQSGFFDPLIHFSVEFLGWIKQQTIDVAQQCKMRLMWNVGNAEIFEFRDHPTQPRPRKIENDHWDWRMRHLLPGFCRNSYNRIRIEVNGNVAPCCYATEGQLSLGNLNEQDFDDIWNGKPAQDLRRGMYTGDVPRLCKNCLVRMPPEPVDAQLFLDPVRDEMHQAFFEHGEMQERLLTLTAPNHLERLDEPPFIHFETPFQASSCLVAVALGGETSQIETALVEVELFGDRQARFRLPDSIWQSMKTNLGYWYTIWQSTGESKPVCRTEKIHCMIRHEGLPRLAGSQLAYPNEENGLDIVDIGASKNFGFSGTSEMKVASQKADRTDHQEPNQLQSERTESATSIEATGRLMSHARRILAYGGLDGVMNRPLMHESGSYPQFAIHASGFLLTDSTGRDYIDWVNGWGCIFLGHAHSVVTTAVTEQVQKGTSFGLMNPIEIEVAQQLTELIPCAEKVAFGKNGSDVINAAIRMARAATGRDLILQCGFHGFHDWYTCLHEDAKGILPVLRDYVIPFEYNNLEQLNNIFREHQDKIAGIVMEPVNMFMPDEGYLESVSTLARENGAVLVFDEVVTAFRMANGGAQQYFNVIPDIACLGKAMGNGLPLAAVVGKETFMRHLPSVAYGMTFRGEALSLAAARAVLEFVKHNDVPGHLKRIGDQVREQFNQLATEHGVICELYGPSSRMTFVFHTQGNLTWQQQRSIFVLECLKLGVLTNGNLLVSFAHDDAAVAKSLDVFDQALARVAQAIEASGTKSNDAKHRHDASAINVSGFLDAIDHSDHSLEIGGWLLLDDAIADGVTARLGSGESITAETVSRPDIAEAFPNVVDGQCSGFSIAIPRTIARKSIEETGKFEFTIIASQDSIDRFHCLVSLNEIHGNIPSPMCLSDGFIYVSSE